jgi:hypothetical protein
MKILAITVAAIVLAGCPAGEEPAKLSNYEVVRINESTTIDCNGTVYNKGKTTELQIVTTKNNVPTNVTIKNCKINGSIRIAGLGFNGEAPGVKISSKEPGHTERAQAVAPNQINLYNLTITGKGRIPLYIAPGVTKVSLVDSTINGRSDSVALYLDAESGFNIVRNNTFDITGASREIIAVDGSANNQILANNIKQAPKGGIYLYRNCGEGGTVRHQSPQHNLIAGNSFNLTGLQWSAYGIWLGSRDGGRLYCSEDAGLPFGSSKDNSDFADNNVIKDNVFTGSLRTIRDNGTNNKTN